MVGKPPLDIKARLELLSPFPSIWTAMSPSWLPNSESQLLVGGNGYKTYNKYLALPVTPMIQWTEQFLYCGPSSLQRNNYLLSETSEFGFNDSWITDELHIIHCTLLRDIPTWTKEHDKPKAAVPLVLVCIVIAETIKRQHELPGKVKRNSSTENSKYYSLVLLVLVLLIVRIPEAANKKQKTATKKSKARHAGSKRCGQARQPPTVVALGLGTQKPVNDRFLYSSDGNSGSSTGSISSDSSNRGRQEEEVWRKKNKGRSILSKENHPLSQVRKKTFRIVQYLRLTIATHPVSLHVLISTGESTELHL